MSLSYIGQLLSFGSDGWGDEIAVGALITCTLGISSFLLGIAVAIPCAVVKVWGTQPIRVAAGAYTTLIRGVPELLIIYLVFFGGNTILMSVASIFGYDGYFELRPFLVGLVALTLVSAGYSCEVLRGALQVLRRGQTEAARALGLSRSQAFFLVLLPQTLRFALPGLGNVWQVTLKSTSLVSVTALAELMRVSYVAAGSTRQPLFFYAVAGILYLAIVAVSGHATTLCSRFFPYIFGRVGS